MAARVVAGRLIGMDAGEVMAETMTREQAEARIRAVSGWEEAAFSLTGPKSKRPAWIGCRVDRDNSLIYPTIQISMWANEAGGTLPPRMIIQTVLRMAVAAVEASVP
jgi:hypothetical protein